MKKVLLYTSCLFMMACDSFLLQEEEALIVPVEENISVPVQLNDGLSSASPESADINMEKIENYIQDVQKNAPNNSIRSMLIARHNKLVVEAYFNGWNRERKQDMRSATKSITSSLIGIGIDKGILPDENVKILDFFAGYDSFDNWDDGKLNMTVRDFLRMRTGLACNDWSPSSLGNEEFMYRSNDWVKFILDLPMQTDSGQNFSYCTGSPVTLGAVLANASGKSIPEFAEENLFSHLSISDYNWEFTPIGRTDTGGHLHLRPRDMLKIGLVFLNNGFWDGKQIVSNEWVQKSTRPTGLAGNHEYGYLWWNTTWSINGSEISSYFAWGNGGQHIFVLPQLDAVVVLTGGKYSEDTPGFNLMENIILPSFQ